MAINFKEALRALKLANSAFGGDTPIKVNPNLKKIAGYSNLGNLLHAVKKEINISDEFMNSEFLFVNNSLFRFDEKGTVDEDGKPERRIQFVLKALLAQDETVY